MLLIVDRWQHRPDLLKNAALVSREWCHRARHHLFKQHKIYPRRSPQLPTFITLITQTLEVDGEREIDLLECLELISPLVSSMTRLTTISLFKMSPCDPSVSAWPIRWLQSTQSRKRIHTLSLRDTTVHTMGEVLLTIASFPYLHSIALWTIGTQEGEETIAESDARYTVDALLRLPPPRRLQSLIVYGLTRVASTTCSLWIQRARTSVETLHWGTEAEPGSRCETATKRLEAHLGAAVETVKLIHYGQSTRNPTAPSQIQNLTS